LFPLLLPHLSSLLCLSNQETKGAISFFLKADLPLEK
jgi:hypothetical protein